MHPCAICATLQHTCCQRAEIVVTTGDLRRIERSTGLQDTHERRVPLDPAYTDVDPSDPTWRTLTARADGSRRQLKRRENGDCVFLGETGCRLDEATRPLVCRLYPFAYTARGLDGVDDEYCPKTLFCRDGRSMVDVLGMSVNAAEVWRAALYRELEEDAALVAVAQP